MLTETYLKDMKSFKLDVAAVVSQNVHHEFQVLGSTDVFGHDCEVVSVQQELSQELCATENRQHLQGSNFKQLHNHMRVLLFTPTCIFWWVHNIV